MGRKSSLSNAPGVQAPPNRPALCQKHPMPSSSINCSIRLNASAPSASTARAGGDPRSRPLLADIDPAAPPPLRVLAPKPSSAVSSTTQSIPGFAASSAVDRPP
jgi:hypothetical protein